MLYAITTRLGDCINRAAALKRKLMRAFPVLYMEAGKVFHSVFLWCKIAKKENIVLRSGLLTSYLS